MAWRCTAANYPLHLISSQPRYRLHSQMDPGPIGAAGKVARREAVAIKPEDAKQRGIADGDVVRRRMPQAPADAR
jgi:biotin/methionine sulfoxide reductase